MVPLGKRDIPCVAKEDAGARARLLHDRVRECPAEDVAVSCLDMLRADPHAAGLMHQIMEHGVNGT